MEQIFICITTTTNKSQSQLIGSGLYKFYFSNKLCYMDFTFSIQFTVFLTYHIPHGVPIQTQNTFITVIIKRLRSDF